MPWRWLIVAIRWIRTWFWIDNTGYDFWVCYDSYKPRVWCTSALSLYMASTLVSYNLVNSTLQSYRLTETSFVLQL